MQLRTLKMLERVSPDKRAVERVALALPARYMLSDGSEHVGWTVDVSPIGIAITGLRKGRIGEHVVAYIDQLGRIEGSVVRRSGRAFAIAFEAAHSRREKIENKIAWLVELRALTATEKRQAERVAPKNWRITLRTLEGRGFVAAVVDIGFPGAALNVDAAPPVGSSVVVGDTMARVVRHFPGGIAVEFDSHLSGEIVQQAKRLADREVSFQAA